MLEKDREDSLTECVRSGEVLHTVKEEKNILHTVKRRKADWIGYILRRNCHLKRAIEGNIQGRICDGKARKKTSTATA
jgi:hypothetical protein